MSWLKKIQLGESGTQKAVLALGAAAVASVAAVQLKRVITNWREEHLEFDFPLEEELFIGWGGSTPRRVKRAA